MQVVLPLLLKYLTFGITAHTASHGTSRLDLLFYMVASALCEAAKNGDVNELRALLATASPADVNTAEPKHGYCPLHYGA